MPEKPTHNRRSIRLPGYDYSSPGAYFVTLVTHHRNPLFGSVINGKMQHSALGKIVIEEWMRSNAMRQEIEIHEDEFILMPNHLHGIVWIVGADGFRPEPVGAGFRPVPVEAGVRPVPVGADGVRPEPVGTGVHPGPEAFHPPQQGTRRVPPRKPKSLSSFIAGFKSSVTSRARHELDLTDIWQRNYYEHIVRNEQELTRIWDYIDTNPIRWQDDQLFPVGPPIGEKP